MGSGDGARALVAGGLFNGEPKSAGPRVQAASFASFGHGNTLPASAWLTPTPTCDTLTTGRHRGR